MTTEDLRSALAGDDGSLPERWNPDDVPGTTVVGTLKGYETIATQMGEGTIAVIIDDEDEHEWGVALFRTVLRKRFDTLEPKPGDTVGVKYVGWVEPKNKDARGYHNYVVRVIRGQGAPLTVVNGSAGQATTDEDDLPF